MHLSKNSQNIIGYKYSGHFKVSRTYAKQIQLSKNSWNHQFALIDRKLSWIWCYSVWAIGSNYLLTLSGRGECQHYNCLSDCVGQNQEEEGAKGFKGSRGSPSSGPVELQRVH